MKNFVLTTLIIFVFFTTTGVFLYKGGYLHKWTDNGAFIYKWQLKLFPDNPVALNRLATHIRHKPEFDQVLAQYVRFYRLDHEGVALDEEKIARQKQIVENVLKMYVRATELDESYTAAYLNLAELYDQMGQSEVAFEYYLKVIELEPDNFEARFRVGLLFLKNKKFEEAVQVFAKILKDDSKNEDMYLQLFKFYEDYLKLDPSNERIKWAQRDVIEAYTDFINQNSSKALSYYNLGGFYKSYGQPHRAISAYQMALDLDPKHAKTLYNLGNIRKDQGRLKDAIELYKKALKSNPRLGEAYTNLGVVYGAMGNLPKSKEVYLKGLQKVKDNDRLYFNLGFVQEATGYYRDALNSYTQAHNLNPQNAEAFYNKGNVLAKLKKIDEAMRAYESTLDIDPNHLDAAVNLCVIAVQAKKFQSAVEYCDEAVLLGYQLPADLSQILAKYKK